MLSLTISPSAAAQLCQPLADLLAEEGLARLRDPTTLLAVGQVSAQSTNPQAQQFFEQARQAHAEGDAQKAIDLYRKAIEADPQFVEAYLKLGELLAVLDRFDEARTVYQKAKEIAPRRGDVRAWLVYVLFKLGDYSAAVEEGQNARPFVTPGDLATVAYYVGLAHERLGNLEEAARWLNEAASIEAGGLSGLAEMALIDVYQRMLTQRRDPELTLKVAVLLYRRERYTEALITLQALTTDAPRYAPAFYWLGLVNMRIAEGFTSPAVRRRYLLDARRAFERYLELAPNGEFAGEVRRLLQTLPSP
ncbi:MAG: tetratricopeptide repeat protein [Armatimonadota bacterium]|nr:tetratricopeptide repeat protein [Armatimonadota bacterium]MDR7532201.1 tetratricopeptide repeat protein [Armatimonadota bacterium]